MSVILQSCAGTIHVFAAGASGGDGFGLFKLDPPIPSSPPNSMCFIDSIPLTAREIVQPVVTLDDSRFIYVFGSAWTEAAITGRLLLGRNGGGATQLKSLKDWYNTARIGKRRKYISASAGAVPIKAFITGMQVGEIDPNTYVQPFALSTLVNLDI